MAEVNLQTQLVDISVAKSAPNANKVKELYKASIESHKTKLETVANDDNTIVQTSALYVITPDGVIHVRKTNDIGEVNYAPDITIQSYHKAKSE